MVEVSGEGRRPKARMTGTYVTRARSKKKAHHRVIVLESLEYSVAMSEVNASATDAREEWIFGPMRQDLWQSRLRNL